MKCAAPVVALVFALTIGCGSSSHTTPAPVIPSIAGSWNVELTQNGTTQSLFRTTLVSEGIVNSTYGPSCNLSTSTGVFTEAALNLTGCYVADSMMNQGSFTSSGTYTPQAVLVETLENSSDVNVTVVETDPFGSLFVFSGNGTATSGSMTGNWMCNTDWSSSGQGGSVCAGWSGTFSGTQN
jgi:hypothetical protein